jgi:hypothetical protein
VVFLVDLTVGLALVREKLGIGNGAVPTGRERKLGPSKLDLMHRGVVQPATVMTEENIASFFDLSLEVNQPEKNPEPPNDQSRPTGESG